MMSKKRLRYPLYAALFSCASVVLATSRIATAEQLQIPQPNAQAHSSAQPWNVAVPNKGMSKANVESNFGSPDSKAGPTGSPPIYYWEYAEFTVYFESDYVIHTVRKYKPQ